MLWPEHDGCAAQPAHIAPGVRLGGEVMIGAGTLVGIGATVMPQRAVGARSVVGAGAAVTPDVAGGVLRGAAHQAYGVTT